MIIGAAKRDDGPSIEMTPIIDMVFLLLIFFLVATTFQEAEREMQIVLPEAEAAGPITASLREMIINVTADGGVVVGGRSVSLEGLRGMVADALDGNPEQKVSIRGDRGASYGDVARVLDICKLAGVTDPFLDTVPLN